MRKLIWMLSVSLDGFMEGPGGDLGWHRVDEELHRHFNEVLAAMGAVNLAFQALAGPIVMHLLWRPTAASRADEPPARRRPLAEVVDELVGVWLRAMATDQQAAPEAATATPPRPRSKRVDRPDPDQPPRSRA